MFASGRRGSLRTLDSHRWTTRIGPADPRGLRLRFLFSSSNWHAQGPMTVRIPLHFRDIVWTCAFLADALAERQAIGSALVKLAESCVSRSFGRIASGSGSRAERILRAVSSAWTATATLVAMFLFTCQPVRREPKMFAVVGVTRPR